MAGRRCSARGPADGARHGIALCAAAGPSAAGKAHPGRTRHLAQQGFDQGEVCLQVMGKPGHVHVGQIDADLATDTEGSEAL